MVRIISALILIFVGVAFSSFGKRPWLDYDFLFVWYGILLLLDSISEGIGGYSLFSNFKTFLKLAILSSFFWWFYEWLNLFLKNWSYPFIEFYNTLEFGVFATLAFTTVLPLLSISTTLVAKTIFKEKLIWSSKKVRENHFRLPMVLGLLCLVLVIFLPLYFFPLTWFVLFLIFDPINAINNKKSLLKETLEKNYKPLIILATASLFAGVMWETVNFFIPKWTYEIVPWFWNLPAPVTTKYIEMPLAGFLGYIPFAWSAFSLCEFLDLGETFFANKKRGLKI